MLQDLRHAFRLLRRSPAFTAVAILSLALGIGANTAVFSVVNAVLLRQLPYPNPDQLGILMQADGGFAALSIPQYRFWKENSKSFASIAGYRCCGDRGLATGSSREWIPVGVVTTDFLKTLGVTPALGREFTAEETDQRGPQAVILSAGVWQRNFGRDPNILGRAVTLDSTTFTVVGVLPESFWFPSKVEALVPLRPTGSMADSGMNTPVIARLRPDVTMGQAQAETGAVSASYRLANGLPAKYRGLAIASFHSWLVGDVRTTLMILFGAVVLLLVISCSNLASLLLARLAARRSEIAVRLALGGGLRRLLVQFLVENTLLALAGCAAALIGAYWLLSTFVAFIPFHLPASTAIRLDREVLGFTVLIALGTAVVFTLAPFWTARGMNLNDALKSGGRSESGGARQRTRSTLVVAEVAVSVTLLVAAALLIQSLYRLNQERLGFRPQGLLTFSTPLAPAQRRSAAQVLAFQNTLAERLQATPGIRGVAAANALPLASYFNIPTQREGRTDQSVGGMEIRFVTPAYFEMMGIPVTRGRAFGASDARSAPPVVIVNETLARRWWGGGSPVGDRLKVGRFQGKDFPEVQDSPREVVGVVADTKTYSLKSKPSPTVFLPAAQVPEGLAGTLGGSMTWIVRADAGVALGEAVRRTVAEIDPGQRILRLQGMEEIVSSTTADSRFDAWLLGTLAALALLLTGIGVYGLLAYSVAQRKHEIGTRLALGASRGDIMRLVLRQGVGLTAVGLCLGLAGAFLLARSLATLLFGVKPNDPLSFGMVAVVLFAIGFLASYLPARRATKTDPMIALRYE